MGFLLTFWLLSLLDFSSMSELFFFNFHRYLFLWSFTVLARWLNTRDSAVSRAPVSVWIPTDADLETRIWVRKVHVGTESLVRTGKARGREEADRGCAAEAAALMRVLSPSVGL